MTMCLGRNLVSTAAPSLSAPVNSWALWRWVIFKFSHVSPMNVEQDSASRRDLNSLLNQSCPLMGIFMSPSFAVAHQSYLPPYDALSNPEPQN